MNTDKMVEEMMAKLDQALPSKRDKAAMELLKAAISNPAFLQSVIQTGQKLGEADGDILALWAYRQADNLIDVGGRT